MKNRKYIIILSMVLVVFCILHNSFFLKAYEFHKAEEYVFTDKKPNQILKDCKMLYDNLGHADQMLNIVKLIQLSEYLLYEDSIDSMTYHDLMMTIMSLENRESFNHKESNSVEIDKYLDRKRKTGIQYIKYEASHPVTYEREDMKYGYIVIKAYWDNGMYYLKYNLIYEDGFWHFMDAQAIDQVKEKG